MLSYRNVLRAFGLAVALFAITSTRLTAGELVQFDATSGDAGSLKLLGYLARPLRPDASPPSLFSMAAAVSMIALGLKVSSIEMQSLVSNLFANQEHRLYSGQRLTLPQPG
jgi:hypothetical protein